MLIGSDSFSSPPPPLSSSTPDVQNPDVPVSSPLHQEPARGRAHSPFAVDNFNDTFRASSYVMNPMPSAHTNTHQVPQTKHTEVTPEHTPTNHRALTPAQRRASATGHLSPPSHTISCVVCVTTAGSGGGSGCLKPLRRHLTNLAHKTMHHPWFERFILTVILVNTIDMAMTTPGEVSPHWKVYLERTFLAIFITEMSIKMTAMGIYIPNAAGETNKEGTTFGTFSTGYFSVSWNWLDFVVVASAVAGELLAAYAASTGAEGEEESGGIVVVRVVRVLRPLKTVSSLPKLATMIVTMTSAVAPMMKSMSLVFVFCFMMSIFGNAFWSGQGGFFDEDTLYMSFDNVFYSLVTIFQIVTMEGWSENLMYPLMNTAGPGIVPFCALCILVGGFWLLNLAITVLTNEYETARDAQELEAGNVLMETFEKEREEERERNKKDEEGGSATRKSVGGDSGSRAQSGRMVGGSLKHTESAPLGYAIKSRDKKNDPFHIPSRKSIAEAKEAEATAQFEPLEIEDESSQDAGVPWRAKATRFLWDRYDRFNDHWILQAYFSFRKAYLQPVIHHDLFDAFIFLVIICNTVVLASEASFDGQGKKDTLTLFNDIFTTIFAVEMMLKMIAMGWPNYFKEGWNVFDCIIVVSSLYTFGVEVTGKINGTIEEGEEGQNALGDASALRALRVFRVLRAVKAVKHFEATQNIIAVFESAAEEYVLFMFLLSLSMFIVTLTGMNLFGAKYDECDAQYNEGTFNSLMSSFALVFRVLTIDDWNAIAFGGTVCMGHNWTVFFFFLFWIVLGNFMLLNLFLAILIRSFEKMKEKKDLIAAQEAAEEDSEDSEEREEPLPPTSAKFTPLNTIRRISTAVYAARGARRNTGSTGSGGQRGVAPSVVDRTESSAQHGRASPRTSQSHLFSNQVHSPTLHHAARKFSTTLRAFVPVREERAESLKTEDQQLKENHVREGVDHVIKAVGYTLASPFTMIKHLADSKEERRKEKLGKLNVRRGSRRGSTEDAEIEATMRGVVAFGGDKAAMQKNIRSSTVTDRPHSELVDYVPIHGRALGLFSSTNVFRIVCHEIAHHKVFNNFILLCIIMSSVTLAMETPTITDDDKATLVIIDRMFTYIFTFEMALKIVSLGLLGTGDSAYLRSPWYRLDFVVVTSSVLDIFLQAAGSGKDIGFLKVIRLLRVLRPLRTVKQNKNMAHAVGTIMGSFMSVANVAVLLAMIFGVFSILGTGLFGGLFWSCNDETLTTEATCTGTFVLDAAASTVPIDRQWANDAYNFDNFWSSFSTLFVVASLEGWYSVCRRAMAVSPLGIGNAPLVGMENETSGIALAFFCVFICLANFLGLGLFVGVLCDHYRQEAKESGKKNFVTEEQQAWIDTQRAVLFSGAVARSRPPTNPVRKFVWDIVQHPVFNTSVMGVILLSVVVTACNYEGQSEGHTQMLLVFNQVFTALFAVEAALKLIGDGPTIYFGRWPCVFDFTLVVFSLLDEFLAVANGNASVLFVMRIFRVFRVSRLLRLLGPNSGFRNLIKVILYSLPAVWNIASLLMMLYVTYAILGITLFGDTLWVGDPNDGDFKMIGGLYSEGVNPDANFRTFGRAFLTLFRASTGENWHNIAADCQHDNAYESPLVASLFFFSFAVICQYVTLNLFIAVLLDNFNVVKNESKEANEIKEAMIDFVDQWGVYDPDATQFISIKQLPYLVVSLSPPFGLDEDCNVKEIELFLWETDIPIYRFPASKTNKVYFKDVLFRCCRRAFGELRAEATSKQVDTARSSMVGAGGEKDPNETHDEIADVIEMLRKKKMIFSTREYIALKRLLKLFNKNKSGSAFIDLVLAAARANNKMATSQKSLGGSAGKARTDSDSSVASYGGPREVVKTSALDSLMKHVHEIVGDH